MAAQKIASPGGIGSRCFAQEMRSATLLQQIQFNFVVPVRPFHRRRRPQLTSEAIRAQIQDEMDEADHGLALFLPPILSTATATMMTNPLMTCCQKVRLRGSTRPLFRDADDEATEHRAEDRAAPAAQRSSSDDDGRR